MMLLALLVSVLPGLACGLAVCTFRPFIGLVPLPILFSLGYYLGFLLLSVGIDSSKAIGLPVSGEVVIAIFASVLLASSAYFWLSRHVATKARFKEAGHSQSLHGSESLKEASPILWVWLLPGLVLTAVLGLQLGQAPVSGWDILGSWPVHARQLIEQGLNGGVIGNYGDLQSHPTASTTLLGWASWASYSAGAVGLWPWLFAGICIWLAIYGYGVFRRQALGASVVATAIVVTPLLENHVGLPGYSEIWLTVTSVVAAALLAIAIKTQKLSIAVLAVLSALLCVWTRKTGIANTMVLVFALLLALFYTSNWASNKKLVVFVMLLTSLVSFFIVTGFHFSIAGINTNWSPETLTLEFAGRHLELAWQGAYQVFVNEVHSKLTNMSFSIALLAAIFASCVILSRVATDKHAYAAGLFLLCAFLGNFLVLVLAQLFSADGMTIALPYMDTGNSRYFLPAVGITGLLVVEAMAIASRASSTMREATIG